jgi:FMN phosphatase YigB (HAD superfamily)
MIKLTDIAKKYVITENKKLRVFDFDDTVVMTDSFIYVTHRNGKTSKLTPGEYAVYKEQPGDQFDYSDFQNVNNPTEIKKVTNFLKTISKKTTGDLFILTARAAYKPIKQYLSDIGIRNIYVVALGSNNPMDKANWIEDKIDNEGYDDVFFIDDSKKNVDAAKNMLKNKQIKWRVQLVKH